MRTSAVTIAKSASLASACIHTTSSVLPGKSSLRWVTWCSGPTISFNPWASWEQDGYRRKTSRCERALEFDGFGDGNRMDFKPARDFLHRTVRFHAPGQNGGRNAIAKNDRLPKAPARIECHQVSLPLGPPPVGN